jgi:hypothetical protein
MPWPNLMRVKALPLKVKIGIVFFGFILILIIGDIVAALNSGPTRQLQKWNNYWMNGRVPSNSQDGSH